MRTHSELTRSDGPIRAHGSDADCSKARHRPLHFGSVRRAPHPYQLWAPVLRNQRCPATLAAGPRRVIHAPAFYRRGEAGTATLGKPRAPREHAPWSHWVWAGIGARRAGLLWLAERRPTGEACALVGSATEGNQRRVSLQTRPCLLHGLRHGAFAKEILHPQGKNNVSWWCRRLPWAPAQCARELPTNSMIGS